MLLSQWQLPLGQDAGSCAAHGVIYRDCQLHAVCYRHVQAMALRVPGTQVLVCLGERESQLLPRSLEIQDKRDGHSEQPLRPVQGSSCPSPLYTLLRDCWW